MTICVDPNRVARYVLKADRDKPVEQRSVFLLKHPTEGGEKAIAMASQQSGVHLIWAALREGLAGWENFPAGGPTLEFVKDGNGQPASSTILRIGINDRDEIATAISRLGQLTEADLGN
jgi:hypothetical protein